MQRLVLNFFLTLFVTASLISCASVPQSGIVENDSYEWKNKSFELNSENAVFTATGEVTMWVDDVRYKGRFNGDYQAFSASPYKWRIIITGPFNMSVATVIINGLNAHIFHDDRWESKPWHEISNGLFNSYIDGNLFSVMLGGKFRFNGQCAGIGRNSELCRMNGIYYLMEGDKVVEIKSGELYAVLDEGRWIGVRDNRHAFIFRNKKVESLESLPEAIFDPMDDEEDEFDAL